MNDIISHQTSLENGLNSKETAQIQEATPFATAKTKITSTSAMAFTVDNIDIQSQSMARKVASGVLLAKTTTQTTVPSQIALEKK